PAAGGAREGGGGTRGAVSPAARGDDVAGELVGCGLADRAGRATPGGGRVAGLLCPTASPRLVNHGCLPLYGPDVAHRARRGAGPPSSYTSPAEMGIGGERRQATGLDPA